MDLEMLPRKLVVPSLTQANAEIEMWLRHNKYDAVKDADGQIWALTVKAERIMRRTLQMDLVWEVQMRLEAAVNVQQFVATGVLDPQKDERMMDLIGDAAVPLKMRPIRNFAQTEDDVKLIILEGIPKLRSKLLRSSLIEVKRTLIGRWLNARCSFGAELADTPVDDFTLKSRR
jgi:hypothetical protein